MSKLTQRQVIWTLEQDVEREAARLRVVFKELRVSDPAANRLANAEANRITLVMWADTVDFDLESSRLRRAQEQLAAFRLAQQRLDAARQVFEAVPPGTEVQA